MESQKTTPITYIKPLIYTDLNWFDEAELPEEVPVVDFANLNTTDELSLFLESIKRSGFFYLKNHGINGEQFSELISVYREFFCLSDEEKAKMVPSMEEVATTGGFQPFRTSSIGEAFKRGEPIPDEFMKYYWQPHKNYYPNEEFKAVNESYHSAINSICSLLVKKILLSVQTEFPEFDPKEQLHLSKGNAITAYNVYPEIMPNDVSEFRLAFHRDVTSVSILHQLPMKNGEISLCLKTAGGKLIYIPPIREGLLINLGEIFQYITNGLFEAAEHGVLLPNDLSGSERSSIVTFYTPGFDAFLKPSSQIRPHGLDKHLNGIPTFDILGANEKGVLCIDVLKQFFAGYNKKTTL